MWISKKKMAAIEKRLEDLEAFKRDSEYYRYFDVYDQEYLDRIAEQNAPYQKLGYYTTTQLSPLYKQTISLKDVVEKILQHVGLKLVYVQGRPQRVDVAPAKVAR